MFRYFHHVNINHLIYTGVDGSTPKRACIIPCFIPLYSDHLITLKLFRIHGKVVPFHMALPPWKIM